MAEGSDGEMSLSAQFADHSWGTPTFPSVEYRGCSGLKLTIPSTEVACAIPVFMVYTKIDLPLQKYR